MLGGQGLVDLSCQLYLRDGDIGLSQLKANIENVLMDILGLGVDLASYSNIIKISFQCAIISAFPFY